MIPSLGRTVHYCLTVEDAVQINRRRTDGPSIVRRLVNLHWHEGAQAHIGTPVKAGDVFPMTIVAVAPPPADGEPDVSKVNGQVLLDGNDVFWARGVPQVETGSSDKEGCWFEPPRVPPVAAPKPETTSETKPSE